MHVPAGQLRFDADKGRWSVRCKLCGVRLDRSPRPKILMVVLLEELGWLEARYWAWCPKSGKPRYRWTCPKCKKKDGMRERSTEQ